MKLAVVGVTGAVGETILQVLDERHIPIAELGAFASRDRETPLRFRGRDLPIRAASAAALDGYDVVLFAGGEEASADLVERCLEQGAFVIDNSATFRMRPGVPLVVPEINGESADLTQRLFPVGNCTAIVVAMGLAPVARAAGLRTARVASYQAVSGAGRPGLDELAAAETALGAGLQEPAPRTFSAKIARNVIPQVGSFDANGDSGEELKVAAELRKILGLPHLHVAATTVRVPVRTAHSAVVFVETERDTSVPELAEALSRGAGIVYHPTGIVTPRDVEGGDDVHVARLRREADSPRHFQFWVVGDQLRKGAATNGVQILELLLQARGGELAARPKSASISA